MENKSFQWFGATVSSSGDTGVAVACAPRYVSFGADLKTREPVGNCFISTPNSDAFVEFSPCRERGWGYHNEGFCQAGFSSVITPEGDYVAVGAPGSYYWQGQGYSY